MEKYLARKKQKQRKKVGDLCIYKQKWQKTMILHDDFKSFAWKIYKFASF